MEEGMFNVKDMKLAEKGKLNIEWAEAQMGALMKVRERFEREKPLKGIRVGMALHITKETAALVRTMVKGGADVAITGCNPLSTQDDVAAALAKEGIRVYGWKGETREEYYQNLQSVLSFKPQLTVDDGGDLVHEIHTKHQELIQGIIGGTEETTTGVIRLRAMEEDKALRYPLIAVNDSETKHLFDNYLGTGQSTFDGIIRASNILIAGKTVVVAGFGDCGRGVASRAKGLGARVIVTEVNPVRALQAFHEGYEVMKMENAARVGDIFITVTGDKRIITIEHVKKMKDGAILANAGHFDVELDVEGLRKYPSKQIRAGFERFDVGGKHIYLCGEGRLVNLAVAEGHPSGVMDLSFCNQALALEYLVKNRGKLENRVYVLPRELDEGVAMLKLKSLGVEIDSLTEEQREYLHSWNQGT